jgi:hypothetical protein
MPKHLLRIQLISNIRKGALVTYGLNIETNRTPFFGCAVFRPYKYAVAVVRRCRCGQGTPWLQRSRASCGWGVGLRKVARLRGPVALATTVPLAPRLR